jgi:outer membrane lipoprotein carrier protein
LVVILEGNLLLLSPFLAVILNKVKNPCIPILAGLLLASTCAFAQQPSDTALIRRVDEHYNHLRTLRAHYTERYAGMGLDRTETGTLLLKKPGLMRWSYDNPPGKVFVLDGRFGWFYTPGDAQVARTPAKQLDDLRSPLRFLLGHTQLAKELDNLATAPEGPNFRITGVPKGMAQRVQLLTLTVTPAGIIQSMRIEETDGSVTDFAFTNIEENSAIPADAFTFVPPPNLPIVNGQPPI